MKKNIIYVLIACFIFTTTSADAQTQGNQGGQMQQMMKQFLKDSVQLSDALVDSVIAIRTTFQPHLRSIYTDPSLSDDDKHAKWLELDTQMVARYKGVGLTDEQIKKIEERDARMRERMKERMKNGGQ